MARTFYKVGTPQRIFSYYNLLYSIGFIKYIWVQCDKWQNTLIYIAILVLIPLCAMRDKQAPLGWRSLPLFRDVFEVFLECFSLFFDRSQNAYCATYSVRKNCRVTGGALPWFLRVFLFCFCDCSWFLPWWVTGTPEKRVPGYGVVPSVPIAQKVSYLLL